MLSIWVYFQRALFPDARGLIPDGLRNGIALAISRAAVEKSHPHLLSVFDNAFLNNISDSHADTLRIFSDCVRLNDYGFLMGPYLRELDCAAQELRFRADQTQLFQRANAILEHMLSFQPMLRLPTKPENEWALNLFGASYAFLLVSRPPELRAAIDAYVERIRVHLKSGTTRVYVIGRTAERNFVYAVLKTLLTIRELKGSEVFFLFRDYRGDEGGIGGLLTVDKVIAKLEIAPRDINGGVQKVETSAPKLDHGDITSASQLEEPKDEFANTIRSLIIQLSDYERAWISLAELGARLRQQIPDFTPERFGGRNLYSVLRQLPFLEFDERGTGPAKSVWVRFQTDIQQGQYTRVNQKEAAVIKVIEDIVKAHSRESGWIFLGSLGHYLRMSITDFAYVEFGVDSFHDFVSRISSLEVEERGPGHSKTYVRLRRS